MVKLLNEIGLTEACGMGVGPVSWLTLEAFQRVTGIPLEGWKARMIRQLSIAYAAESRRAEEETCASPWRAEVTQAERDASEAALRSVLG